jgi:hypothetical protein
LFLEKARMPEMMLPPLESLLWLQGSPADLGSEIQLGLLIQPNCPGCHMYALPLANDLYASKERDFDIYCVSTAFEDFKYNTIESAQALVQDGRLVGASKQRLGKAAPSIPTMPFAYDTIVEKADAPESLLQMALDATKENAREELGADLQTRLTEAALARFGTEVLPLKIAHTFYAVKAMGTPTWFVHTKGGDILDCKFGHKTQDELLKWVDDAKSRSSANNL